MELHNNYQRELEYLNILLPNAFHINLFFVS